MAGGTGDLTRFLLNPKPPQDQKRRALVERAKDRGNEKRRTRIIKLHVSLDSSTAVIDVCALLSSVNTVVAAKYHSLCSIVVAKYRPPSSPLLLRPRASSQRPFRLAHKPPHVT